MSELLKQIAEIQRELKTQDNYGTGHPVYCVEKRYKLYGMDMDYSDDVVWMGPADDPIEVTDPKKIEILDKLWEEDDEDSIVPFGDEEWPEEICLKNYFKTAYTIQKEHLQTFFTEKAAKEYIENNKHNFRRAELVMYVDSVYRNPEMILIREFLKNTIISY